MKPRNNIVYFDYIFYSFNEYCFRFGRRYQQELRRRRTAQGASSATASAASNSLPGESEASPTLLHSDLALNLTCLCRFIDFL